MELPYSEPKQLAEVVTLANNMASYLETIWCKSANPQELMFLCLVLIYEVITESGSPCPALAAVLQLVPEPLITQAARELATAPGSTTAGLTATLEALCDWLLKWPKATHVSQWIVALVDALCQDGKIDVVADVSSRILDRLVEVLHLPVLRTGVFASLRCLINFADPAVVQLCEANKIPTVINQLKRENTLTSVECIQWLKGVKHVRYIGPDSVIPGKVGLTNLGNTCYMNSVLQALFMTNQFRSDVLEEVCRGSRPVLTRLQELFALLHHSHRPSLSPRALFNVACPASFDPGDQQDSSEFLIYLLDRLHEEENSTDTFHKSDNAADQCPTNTQRTRSLSTRNTVSEETGKSLHRSRSHSADGISEFLPPLKQTRSITKCSSISQKSFGGKMQTVSRCHTCFSESVTVDPFVDLQLCFPPTVERGLKIQHLVDFYFKSELLCDDNRYKCDKCARLCDALRTLRVVEPPANLIVTVKHFASNPATKLLNKLHYTERIELPGGVEYYLYAAVIHQGYSLHSGHYFTYARDQSLRWHIYDDDMVVSTTLEDLTKCCLPKTPYVLFYSRSPPVPLPEPVPSISLLQTHLRDLVVKDNAEFTQGQRDEAERRRRRKAQGMFNDNRRDDSDDNNPPSNCGGGRGNGMPTIRFTY